MEPIPFDELVGVAFTSVGIEDDVVTLKTKDYVYEINSLGAASITSIRSNSNVNGAMYCGDAIVDVKSIVTNTVVYRGGFCKFHQIILSTKHCTLIIEWRAMCDTKTNVPLVNLYQPLVGKHIV